MVYPRGRYWHQHYSTSLLISWIRQTAPQQVSGDAKLERVADTPEVCPIIQKDLDRLEKWADMNPMKFKGTKCLVRPPKMTNPMHQDRLTLTIWKAAVQTRTWVS